MRGAMRDPKTSFGQWFKQVKAREEKDVGSRRGGSGRGGGRSGSVFGRLAFWAKSEDQGNSTTGEDGTDVERGGLLPSFMRRSAQPQEPDCCDCGLSYTQRFQIFVMCILGGTALMGLAMFVFLPMVLIFPTKFALTFTLGSFLIQAAFAMLRGPGSHVRGMFAKERLGGTLIYLLSCGLTLYAAIIAQSYLMVVMSVTLQIGSLLWSSVSYLPRGQAALKVFSTFFFRVVRMLCYPCKRAVLSMFSSPL